MVAITLTTASALKAITRIRWGNSSNITEYHHCHLIILPGGNNITQLHFQCPCLLPHMQAQPSREYGTARAS